jgi:hypothetical protein
MREDAEVLRRRLYAPGASAADVERYRGLGIAVRVVPPEDRPPVARRRSPARLLRPVALAVVILAGLALVRVAAREATPVTVPVVRAATAVAMPATDRAAMRTALAERDDVAVAGLLLAYRVPPALRTATRSLLVEQTGSGTATVPVDPQSSRVFRGRATVLLVLDRAARAGWTTSWRRVDGSGVRTLERQQERSGLQSAGEPTSATYRYGSGEQPVQVRVDAPDGVRWAVEVVFTD